MWVESRKKLFKYKEKKKFTGFSWEAYDKLSHASKLCLVWDQSRWAVWSWAYHPVRFKFLQDDLHQKEVGLEFHLLLLACGWQGC